MSARERWHGSEAVRRWRAAPHMHILSRQRRPVAARRTTTRVREAKAKAEAGRAGRPLCQWQCAELRCVTRAAAGETARTRVRSEWGKIVFTTDQSRTQNVGTHSSVRAHAH